MCATRAASEGLQYHAGLRPLNPDYHRRLRKRLRENYMAINYLHERGLTDEAIEHFRLGLSLPYIARKSGLTQSDALLYPVIGFDGTFYGKYGYYNIPGVTMNPEEEVMWAHGETRACYAEAFSDQTKLLICESAKDLWSIWQNLQGSSLAETLLLATTTHGAALPGEWTSKEFWSRWEVVYCAYSTDELNEAKASRLAGMSGRETRQLFIPDKYSSDWRKFWKSSGVEEFSLLLDEAPIISPYGSGEGTSDGLGFGCFQYNPIDINGAFHGGHLYYTAQVLRREPEVSHKRSGAATRDLERLDAVVVRSDRTLHKGVRAPAPRGTSNQHRVLRLTDGTLIDREPQPNRFSTWSWPSIKSYLDGRSRTRPLGEILEDVVKYLKSGAHLPDQEDYAILALTVVVTYAQAIFDSVPLITLEGPINSGQRELAMAMFRICANPYVCGHSSAISIARNISEARGLTICHDLGWMRARGGELGELAQAIEASGRRSSALTHRSDFGSERTGAALNLYGVKLILNRPARKETGGGGFLIIRTGRRATEGTEKEQQTKLLFEDERLQELRDELHTWTFEHVTLIESTYRQVHNQEAGRFDEVTTPLKVIALLAGRDELKSALEIALARQRQRPHSLGDPRELLRQALKNLIREGYQTISVTHLVLEMRRLVCEKTGTSFLTEIPEWAEAEWVGRMLRKLKLVNIRSNRSKRMRLWGTNLRLYQIEPTHLDQVRRSLADEEAPLEIHSRAADEFCRECGTCRFRTLSCLIMTRRERQQ